MIGWLLTQVPLWVWLALALGVLVAVHFAARLGWQQMLLVAGALALGLIWPAAARYGWKKKEAADLAAADRAIKRGLEARRKQEKLNADPARIDDDDGYRRD